jgi:mycoredoxin-dependent peroxiredoxin
MVDVGQEAPDFTLSNQHGESVTLSQYRGSKNVVLVFYPWAFTGVCTGELCSIRDRMGDFDNDDTVTLAVSCDAKYSLRVFAEQEGYKFQLLADHWPHGATAQAYGVFVEAKGAAKRGTFIIDKAGVVRWSVVNEIPDARDPDEYERVLAGLTAAA